MPRHGICHSRREGCLSETVWLFSPSDIPCLEDDITETKIPRLNSDNMQPVGESINPSQTFSQFFANVVRREWGVLPCRSQLSC
ncbi:hypothetical protein AWENTII_008754 [Aspergillus wentii]